MMTGSLSALLSHCLRAGAVLFLFNEIRGFILAAPVLYAIYEEGGSLTALWIGFCSLGGIALSVAVPMIAAKRLRQALPVRSS
jgi:hypothetical protein